MQKFVTLKTFNKPLEAHILKARLETEQIDCYLIDENVSALGYEVGGVRLNVIANQVPRAQQILTQIEKANLEKTIDQVIYCPQCQSTAVKGNEKHIEQSKKSIWTFILSILYAIGRPFFAQNSYTCQACNHQFEIKSS